MMDGSVCIILAWRDQKSRISSKTSTSVIRARLHARSRERFLWLLRRMATARIMEEAWACARKSSTDSPSTREGRPAKVIKHLFRYMDVIR